MFVGLFSGLLSLLGSSVVGSIVGGIFGIINKRSDIAAKAMDLEHERAKWAHALVLRDKDLEYAKVEALGRKDVAIIEAEGAAEIAQMQAIAEAHKADSITGAEIQAAGKSKWAVILALVVNKFVRPLLTVALCYCALKINMHVIDFFTAGWDSFTLTQKYEAGMQAFAWVTGQASAVITYWFMSRGRK